MPIQDLPIPGLLHAPQPSTSEVNQEESEM